MKWGWSGGVDQTLIFNWPRWYNDEQIFFLFIQYEILLKLHSFSENPSLPQFFFTIQLHTNGAHVSKCFIFQNNEQHLEDLIPVAYDVPKIRDSLSTIEEEHQEYDIPRNVNHALKNFDTDDSDPLVNNSEENLYENQAYQDKKEVSKKQTVCLCRFRINLKKWF